MTPRSRAAAAGAGGTRTFISSEAPSRAWSRRPEERRTPGRRGPSGSPERPEGDAFPYGRHRPWPRDEPDFSRCGSEFGHDPAFTETGFATTVELGRLRSRFCRRCLEEREIDPRPMNGCRGAGEIGAQAPPGSSPRKRGLARTCLASRAPARCSRRPSQSPHRTRGPPLRPSRGYGLNPGCGVDRVPSEEAARRCTHPRDGPRPPVLIPTRSFSGAPPTEVRSSASSQIRKPARTARSGSFVGGGDPEYPTTASPMNSPPRPRGSRSAASHREVVREHLVDVLGVGGLGVAVNPTRSQNSAVTTLRSSATRRAEVVSRGVPQSPQNLCPSGFSAPQEWQAAIAGGYAIRVTRAQQ
jgi:hypothetical protein